MMGAPAVVLLPDAVLGRGTDHKWRLPDMESEDYDGDNNERKPATESRRANSRNRGIRGGHRAKGGGSA